MSKKYKIKRLNQEGKIYDINRDYIKEFAMAYNSSYMDMISPHTLNDVLKDINMNPVFKNRDTVEEMVANPKKYEKNLRELSQYLENVLMPIKRFMDYYSKILEFDYTLIPVNSDLKTMRDSAFKKAEKRVYDWLDSLNPKKTFKRLVKGSLVEDAKFYYLRESENGIALQEMPSDYCLITYEDELSYRYSFNMNYFLKSGVDLDGFAPEFRKYYNEIFYDVKNVSPYNPNWVELDPDKAFVFKFDMLKAGLTPPLVGLFVDGIEISTYRNLKKAKTALEAYKLIVGRIPMHKDNSSGNKKNNFSMTADKAAAFSNYANKGLADGVKFMSLPFEDLKMFEFGVGANNEDISDNALKNFINNSGSSQIMSIDKPTQSTVKTSQKVDESFVSHLYYQAEDFINYQLKLISPKYIFRVKFEGTIFDREERKNTAKEWASLGIITDKIGASMGYNPREFDQALLYMRSRGYPEKFEPIQSAYQSSDKGKNGRPEKSDGEISDNGAKAKDHDVNN